MSKTLKVLITKFSRCRNITDEGVKELARQIGGNLEDLSFLQLDFNKYVKFSTICVQCYYSCDNIKDDGVKEVVRQLGNYVKRLQHLELDFKR